MAYAQYTLADLRTDLAGQYESAAFWTSAEADLAINEALRQWNLATWMWRGREHQVTTASQVYFTVAATLLSTVRLSWQEYPLLRSSVTALDQVRPNWEAETIATGGRVPLRPTCWIPVGIRSFAIWPADTAVNHMTIDGVLITPTLADPTDVVSLGLEDKEALLGYALGVVLAFKGPRERWATLAPRGLRIFYQAAAVHRPLLRTLPALQPYFADEPLIWDDPESRKPFAPPSGDPSIQVPAAPAVPAQGLGT